LGISKRGYIMLALTELGIAKNDVDISAKETEDGAAILDAMMLAWDSEGIHLGWPGSNSTPVDPDAKTNTPANANRAIRTNLAIELAPSYGVTINVATMRNAAQSKAALVSVLTVPPTRRTRAGTPLGAGTRPDRGPIPSPFVLPTTPNTTIGDDSEFDF
jgi:hypothetical protein